MKRADDALRQQAFGGREQNLLEEGNSVFHGFSVWSVGDAGGMMELANWIQHHPTPIQPPAVGVRL